MHSTPYDFASFPTQDRGYAVSEHSSNTYPPAPAPAATKTVSDGDEERKCPPPLPLLPHV